MSPLSFDRRDTKVECSGPSGKQGGGLARLRLCALSRPLRQVCSPAGDRVCTLTFPVLISPGLLESSKLLACVSVRRLSRVQEAFIPSPEAGGSIWLQ